MASGRDVVLRLLETEQNIEEQRLSALTNKLATILGLSGIIIGLLVPGYLPISDALSENRSLQAFCSKATIAAVVGALGAALCSLIGLWPRSFHRPDIDDIQNSELLDSSETEALQAAIDAYATVLRSSRKINGWMACVVSWGVGCLVVAYGAVAVVVIRVVMLRL